LISITRSWRSRPLAGTFGKGLDPAVVLVAAAVEDAGLDAGGLGALGQQFAGLLGLVAGRELAQIGLDPVDGGDRMALGVVDELSEDPAIGAVDGEARALGVADDTGADAAAAAQARLALGDNGHARLPTLRATCSPR
jgi:hypothetical protein